MLKKIILGMILMLILGSIVTAEEINFEDANIMDVISILAKRAHLDVVISGDQTLVKKTSVHLKNTTIEQAIECILKTNGFTSQRTGNVLLVSALPQDILQTAFQGVSKAFKLKYLTAERLSALFTKLMPSIISTPGERANSLIIRGKESELKEASALIEDLDKPTPQILISSKVLEIAEADSIRIGIDHNGGIFKFINGKRAEDITSTVSALLGNGKANVVASPRVATLDNHEAIINIGKRVPYAVPYSDSSNSTKWRIDFIDAGVKLKIIPQLGEDNYITTFIQPEISSISEWRVTPAGEFPVISTRNASSTIRVKNGETIVIGGLMLDSDRVNTSRIPILGQFPIINLFFQNRVVEQEKTEIVFMITPYVI